MPTQTIVTLDQAKMSMRKRPDDDSEDSDIQLRLDGATQLVLDYIARPDDEDWTAEIAAWDEDTAPPVIKVAILHQFGEIDFFRGDEGLEPGAPKREAGQPSERLRWMLSQYRDPTLA